MILLSEMFLSNSMITFKENGYKPVILNEDWMVLVVNAFEAAEQTISRKEKRVFEERI